MEWCSDVTSWFDRSIIIHILFERINHVCNNWHNLKNPTTYRFQNSINKRLKVSVWHDCVYIYLVYWDCLIYSTKWAFTTSCCIIYLSHPLVFSPAIFVKLFKSKGYKRRHVSVYLLYSCFYTNLLSTCVIIVKERSIDK